MTSPNKPLQGLLHFHVFTAEVRLSGKPSREGFPPDRQLECRCPCIVFPEIGIAGRNEMLTRILPE